MLQSPVCFKVKAQGKVSSFEFLFVVLELLKSFWVEFALWELVIGSN